MKQQNQKLQTIFNVLFVLLMVAGGLLPACGRNAETESTSAPGDFGFNPGDNSADFEISDVLLNLYPTGSIPNRIHIKGDQAYVVNSGNNNIGRINLATNAVTQGFITLPANSNPWEMAIDGNTGYVSNFVANTVSVVDLANGGAPSKNIAPNANGRLIYPEGITVANGLVFVTNINFAFIGGGVVYNDGFVTIIDQATQQVVNEIPTTQKNPQYAIARGNTVYIVNSGANMFDFTCSCFVPTSDAGIDIIDANTAATANAPVDNILIPINPPTPLRGGPGYLAISADGSTGYMGSNSGNLYKVDLAGRTLLRGNDNPIAVTPSSADNLLTVKSDAKGVFWIASFNEDRVYLLDPDTDNASTAFISLNADANNLEGPIDLDFRNSGDFPDAYVLMSVSEEVSGIITN